MKKILKLILTLTLAFSIFGCSSPTNNQKTILKDGYYYSKEDVCTYLQIYNELPDNFITKDEASKLGWVSTKLNLWEVAKGMCIGGDKFGNREGLLPKEKGRQYYECDIDYNGGNRGGKRIVYSNDGLIYYTEDHYESFEDITYENYYD